MGKIIFGVAFVAMILLSLVGVSALTISSLSNVAGEHGASISNTFTLTNDETANITGVNATLAVSGFSTSQTTSCSLVNITSGNPASCSYTISVPKYQAPQVYAANLTVAYNNGTAQKNSSTFTVNVSNSPTLSLVWITAPANLYQNESRTLQYNLTNTGNIALSGAIASLSSAFGVNSSSAFSLTPGNSATGTISIVTNSTTPVGSKSVSVNATGTGSGYTVSQVLSSSFNVFYPYCDAGSTTGNIKLVEIKNEGDIDGETFKPLETFEIEVKVENTDQDDSHKAIAEAVLVKDNDEVSDTDVKVSLKIAEDDSDTIIIPYTLPADLDEGTYSLYVKVTNDDDEDNCQQTVLQIEIEKSSREIVFDGTIPANVSCGSTTLISGKIVNIGTSDEDKVKVTYSDSFGNTYTTEIDDLNEGDDSPVSFSLKTPRNASESSYSFSLLFSYDYDKDDKTYDDSETATYFFNVAGSCTPAVSNQTIVTEASTAILGIESEVSVKIVNTGTTSQTFTATGSADWADIKSITPSSVTLAAGEQKEITIKLEPKSGTSIGSHDLTVTVQHNGISESKTVQVAVQKASTPSNLIDKLKFYMKYNPTWVVIDAVLVIAIVLVIILLLSGKKSSED